MDLCELCLADAIFAPVDRSDGSRDRRDIDDTSGKIGVALFLCDHPVGGCLGQEVRPLKIDFHDPFVAFFGSVEDIVSRFGCDSGIVDQDIKPPEGLPNLVEDEFSLLLQDLFDYALDHGEEIDVEYTLEGRG